MAVFPPCMIVLGLFFCVIGANAMRTQKFTESIQEGQPSVILGTLFVLAGIGLMGGAGFLFWYISEHGMRGM